MPRSKARIMDNAKGKLIIVPTPIGNLGDVSERVREALASADCIFAEDTRVTGKLLRALGIEGRLERLDETVMAKRASEVAARVRAGETIAYCSDAGMPGVSDPGLRLVALFRDEGLPVEVLPGPSAALTAYVGSGFTATSFFFGGFFPRKAGERRALLENLAALDAALVFYESPNRVVAALDAIAEAYPERRVAFCRELTKLHEEVVRDTATALAATIRKRAEEGRIKGEIVLVIDAPGDGVRAGESGGADGAQAREAAAARARELLSEGVRAKEAAARLAEEFGFPRNAAYELVLAAKG